MKKTNLDASFAVLFRYLAYQYPYADKISFSLSRPQYVLTVKSWRVRHARTNLWYDVQCDQAAKEKSDFVCQAVHTPRATTRSRKDDNGSKATSKMADEPIYCKHGHRICLGCYLSLYFELYQLSGQPFVLVEYLDRRVGSRKRKCKSVLEHHRAQEWNDAALFSGILSEDKHRGRQKIGVEWV